MILFVVTRCYGDVICGVYDSREGAEAGLAECNDAHPFDDTACFSEFTLNKNVEGRDDG